MRRGPRKHHNPNGHIKPLSVQYLEAMLYGKPLPDLHTQKRLEEARAQAQPLFNNPKENDMPDLKSALQAAIQKSREATLRETIDEWSRDEQPAQQLQPETQPKENDMPLSDHVFPATNNVSRATFDYVLNNPGQDLQQICDALEPQGYKRVSITALLSQMRRSNTIHRDSGGCYTALTATYRPVKSSKRLRAEAKAAARAEAKAKAKEKKLVAAPIQAAPKVDTAQAVVPPPAPMQPPAPVQAPALVVHNDVEHILNTLPIKQARELYDALHKIFGSNA